MSPTDSLALRQALGQFATGVTVVTTIDASGKKVGMTASSFNAVSLDPALVLWSIDKNAFSYETFMQARHYAIHVLSADQEELSNHFAQKQQDKFAAVSHQSGLHDIPLLDDYCALFQCEIEHRYEGGDHTILVGRVLAIDVRPGEPLVFHRGQYRRIT